jgi:hypothetical protein
VLDLEVSQQIVARKAKKTGEDLKIVGADDKDLADDKSRALGLLAGYLWSTFGVNQSDLSPDSAKLKAKAVKRFREGTYPLGPSEFGEVRDHIGALLRAPQIRARITRDYDWIRPILVECGLDDIIDPNHRYKIPLDNEFLRSLNLDGSGADAGAITEKMGGLWHIFRLSTDRYGKVAPDIFNVSLLNIKPTTYVKYTSEIESAERIDTRIPHFSLRSRFRARGRGAYQTFRGRVFIVDKTVYFLGDRGQDNFAPKLLVMALAFPHVSEGESHADMVHGVIMGVTSFDTPIVGPVAGHYIRTPSELNARRALQDEGSDVLLGMGKWYDQTIKELLHNIDTFPRADLVTKFQEYNELENVDDVASLIDDMVKEGGYYSPSDLFG